MPVYAWATGLLLITVTGTLCADLQPDGKEEGEHVSVQVNSNKTFWRTNRLNIKSSDNTLGVGIGAGATVLGLGAGVAQLEPIKPLFNGQSNLKAEPVFDPNLSNKLETSAISGHSGNAFGIAGQISPEESLGSARQKPMGIPFGLTGAVRGIFGQNTGVQPSRIGGQSQGGVAFGIAGVRPIGDVTGIGERNPVGQIFTGVSIIGGAPNGNRVLISGGSPYGNGGQNPGGSPNGNGGQNLGGSFNAYGGGLNPGGLPNERGGQIFSGVSIIGGQNGGGAPNGNGGQNPGGLLNGNGGQNPGESNSANGGQNLGGSFSVYGGQNPGGSPNFPGSPIFGGVSFGVDSMKTIESAFVNTGQNPNAELSGNSGQDGQQGRPNESFGGYNRVLGGAYGQKTHIVYGQQFNEIGMPSYGENAAELRVVNSGGSVGDECPQKVWAPRCSRHARPFLVHIGSDLRNKIVYIHNYLRDFAASSPDRGQMRGMLTLRWSPKLASLAEYNVMQCEIKHDTCTAVGYKVTGQNIALSKYTGDFKSQPDEQLVNGTIQNWWYEYQDNKKQMAPLPGMSAMLKEKSNAVGCAASRFYADQSHQFLMTCVYATAIPLLSLPAQEYGCRYGFHPMYQKLCKVPERYIA